MHSSPRVLILDDRNDRRERLAAMASRFGCIRVDPLGAITREEFESGVYDAALVHYNNVEAMFIENGWAAPGTKVVMFSGSLSQPYDEEDGLIFVSARFIENESHLKQVLQKVLAT